MAIKPVYQDDHCIAPNNLGNSSLWSIIHTSQNNLEDLESHSQITESYFTHEN